MTTQEFKGYSAYLDGQVQIRVVNAGTIKMKATGEEVPGLKIRRKIIIGYSGWSSHVAANWRWGDAEWVRADRVKKRKSK